MEREPIIAQELMAEKERSEKAFLRAAARHSVLCIQNVADAAYCICPMIVS